MVLLAKNGLSFKVPREQIVSQAQSNMKDTKVHEGKPIAKMRTC
jgi:hypothetical protein